jgi:hypothetical protein
MAADADGFACDGRHRKKYCMFNKLHGIRRAVTASFFLIGRLSSGI